jgi:hypothetical protein
MIVDSGSVCNLVSLSRLKQLISLGVSLLDALKTSFSRRSLEARSLGGDDRMSDAAIATLALLKVKIINN